MVTLSNKNYTTHFLKAMYQPSFAFDELSRSDPAPQDILFKHSIWLLLLPPVFAWVGANNFGWRLGAEEPLVFSPGSLTLISIGYFLVLLFGFLTTAQISRWMASTYGADTSLGKHFAMITIVGQPLAIASIAHLFPNVFFNVLILIPTMIWSMYLLYTGIPKVLDTTPEQGMLMASSLVGWLLVAAVSLLGISMILWTAGVGPLLGV